MQRGHIMRSSCGIIAALTLITGTACGQGEIDKALGVVQLDLGLPADTSAYVHSSGDYNGDGEKDFLLNDKSFSTVSWLMLSDGSGGWDLEGPYDVVRVGGMAVGQFDEDPGLEVAFRTYQDEYAIALDPGSPAVVFDAQDIAYAESSPTNDAFGPTTKAADLNGDGLDEIILNASDESLYIVWSGLGQIEQIALTGIGSANVLYDPADYDGDGIIDILLFSQSRERFWLIEGTGVGSPEIVREIDRVYPSLAGQDRAVFGDLDGIPGLDLVVGDTNAQTIVAELNFANQSYLSHPVQVETYGVPLEIVGDLDGSGDADLVIMQIGETTLALNYKYIGGVIYDPISADPAFAGLDVGFPVREIPYRYEFPVDAPMPSLTSFDMDQDGDLDLLWFGDDIPHGTIAYGIENRHDVPQFDSIGLPSYDAIGDTLHVLPLDIDGDGKDEYLLSGERNIRILDLEEESLGRITASSDSFMAVAADIDGDGVVEIINNKNGSGDLRVFQFMNDGSIEFVDSFSFDGNYQGLEPADLNNDGKMDIVAQIWNGGTHIFLGGEGPSLTYHTTVVATDPQMIKCAAIDYNQDGFMDLALGSNERVGIELFLNNGDATFTKGQLLESGLSDDKGPYWIVAGDVDQDGVVDIVYSDLIARTVVMFLNTDGTLDEVAALMTGSVLEVEILDVDGNGLPDIALAGSGSFPSEGPNSPGVIKQISPRVFGSYIRLPGGNTEAIALSDVDQDGRLDLVSLSSEEESMRVFYAQAGSCPADLNGDGELNFFDVSEFLAEQVDYNGDGSFNFFDVSAFLVDFKAGCP